MDLLEIDNLKDELTEIVNKIPRILRKKISNFKEEEYQDVINVHINNIVQNTENCVEDLSKFISTELNILKSYLAKEANSDKTTEYKAYSFDGQWQNNWYIKKSKKEFGFENLTTILENGKKLRVIFPKTSSNPRINPKCVGGANFINSINPSNCVILVYRVRFPEDFNFLKGGLLPGLYCGNYDEDILDGINGAKTNVGWKNDGSGELILDLYSEKLSYKGGNWKFSKEIWHEIKEEIQLNTPGLNNGYVKLFFNNKLILNVKNLSVRNSENMKISGINFSAHLAGADPCNITSEDSYLDFDNFRICYKN